MKSFNCFLLVIGVLSAESEDSCSKRLQFLIVIPEGTRLRRAPPGAWNLIPALRMIFVRRTRARKTINDRSTGNFCQIYRLSRSRHQQHRWKPHARKMIASSVIGGYRKIVGQFVNVVLPCHMKKLDPPKRPQYR